MFETHNILKLEISNWFIRLSFSPDFDECSLESNICGENANCSNSPGSYTCVCVSGYSGDSFNNCVSNEESKENKKILFTGLGVLITGLVLIATAIIIAIALVYVQKKKQVAYLSNTHSPTNIADVATSDQGLAFRTKTYTLSTNVNEGYDIPTTAKEKDTTTRGVRM